MKHESFDRSETVPIVGDRSPNQFKVTKSKDRYDLAAVVHLVRRVETLPGRTAVFEEIKKKNLLFRTVDGLYAKAGAGFGQPLVLFAYMMKCAVSVGPVTRERHSAVSISHFPNEHRSIDRVSALVPERPVLRLTLDLKHCLAPSQLGSALRIVGSAARMWPFLVRRAEAI